MSTPRPGSAGATRVCPHCKVTILETAAVCPSCKHHLRYDESAASRRISPVVTPLQVEGTVQHPPEGGPWEYTVVLVIRNDAGKEIARQVVGVGAMQPGEQRSFSLAVEVVQRDDLPGKSRRH